MAKKIGISESDRSGLLKNYKSIIVSRGEFEIEYWNDCIAEIKKYTREEAIQELIKAKNYMKKYRLSMHILRN